MAFVLADQFLIFGHGEWDVSDGSHTLDVVKNLWPSEAKLSNRFKNETPSSCAGCVLTWGVFYCFVRVSVVCAPSQFPPLT